MNPNEIDALSRLSELHKSGDLTDEEFSREKAKLISGPVAAGPDTTNTEFLLTYQARRKSLVLCYLVWWFVGWTGAHRLMLNNQMGWVYPCGLFACFLFIVSGGATLVGALGFYGLAVFGVWWIVDAFLLPDMVRQYNERLISQLKHRQ